MHALVHPPNATARPPLTFLSLNARSIFHKMDELREIATSNLNPTVIAITESWACPEEDNNLYSIPGYHLYRQDRTHSQGGGSMLYVQDKLPHTQLFQQTPTPGESVWASVDIADKTIVLASIYRPPRTDEGDFCHALDTSIRHSLATSHDILLLGDFNAKNSTWFAADNTDPIGESLQCLFDSHDLCQLTTFPTYIHQGQLKSCLDLVITSIPIHLVDITSLAPVGNSDHLTISGRVDVPLQPDAPPQAPPTMRWKWSNTTITRLRELLSESDLLATPGPEENPQQFVTRFCSHRRDTVVACSTEACSQPRLQSHEGKRRGQSNPWITPALLAEIKLKHRLYREYIKTRTNAKWQSFTAQRNRVTMLLRRAKSDFVQSAANNGTNNSNLFRLMKCLRKTERKPIPSLKDNSGHEVGEPKQKASVLNDFFIEQSRRSVEGTPVQVPPIDIPENHNLSLSTISTTSAEVERLLLQLDVTKSAGHDGISTRALKEGASQLAPSLSNLFNASFRLGVLPQDWKDATISPLYKKGDPSLPNNYRPISLLSVVSKVCERVVHTKLYKHLENFLPHHQSGFRKGDGTELQLARLLNDISGHRDRGDFVVACYFDLSKAFDRVWHAGLLAKLSHCSVTDQALSWITAYLTGRRQRVQVDGTTSEWLSIPAGVPQGSVLGPLLFLAYTIDLPTACLNPHTTCSQFADDTALITSHKSYDSACIFLQNSVSAAGNWLSTWHLLVNAEKKLLSWYSTTQTGHRVLHRTLS